MKIINMGLCKSKKQEQAPIKQQHVTRAIPPTFYRGLIDFNDSVNKVIYKTIETGKWTAKLNTVKVECANLTNLLVSFQRNIVDVCCSERIFMLVLMTFLNQSLDIGTVNRSQLRVIYQKLKLKHMLVNQLSCSFGIYAQPITDSFGKTSHRYYFVNRNPTFETFGQLFIHAVSAIKAKKYYHAVIEDFIQALNHIHATEPAEDYPKHQLAVAVPPPPSAPQAYATAVPPPGCEGVIV